MANEPPGYPGASEQLLMFYDSPNQIPPLLLTYQPKSDESDHVDARRSFCHAS